MSPRERRVVTTPKVAGGASIQLPGDLPVITPRDLAEHDHAADPLVLVSGAVLAVAPFLSAHPGGAKVLRNHAGRDATDVFTVFHPDEVWRRLGKYAVATLADVDTRGAKASSVGKGGRGGGGDGDVRKDPRAPADTGCTQRVGGVSAAGEEFRRLHAMMKKEGWYESDLRFFAVKFAVPVALIAAVWYMSLAWAGGLAQCIFSGALLGLAWQQLAFLGHDICHTGVTHNRKIDYGIASHILCPLFGISPTWWKASHNVHHIVTNSVDHDPDIQHLPVFSVSTWFFHGVLSKYHGRVLPFDAIARFLVRYQHYLYYPIMSLARVNLYIQSLLHLVKSEQCEHRLVELAAMGFFFSWVHLVASLQPSRALYALFLLVAHAVSGILHVQITLSHFSMGVYEGVTYRAEEDDFWHTQVATSMNVTTSWYDEWFHGGLQYQVEHHLFPRLPRHRLSKAKPLVEGICRKHGLNYRSLTFLEANKEIINTLKDVSRKVDTPGADRQAQLMFLVDGLNANG